jgi:predicted NAD/FAD-binding protein
VRTAVIGGGISGLAVAWLVKHASDVVVYEREDWLGGHARSIDVGGVAAETGFKYMFDATHARVLALLAALGVPTRRVRTSASVRIADRPCLRLPPRTLRQARALGCDPLARRGAIALARVHLAGADDWSDDLATHLARRFGAKTTASFLLPFFAASWGMPVDVISRFAAYDIVKVVGKGWGGFIEVAEGTSRYIDALVSELDDVELRRKTPVNAVRREGSELVVETADGAERFDHVVLATPARGAAELSPDAELAQACRRFSYVDTETVIHEDASWMPRARDDWAIVNYVFADDGPFATEWSGHFEKRDVFRTWLLPGREPPRYLHHRQKFQHLVVTPASVAAQRAVAQRQGAGGLWTVGMYVTDVDIHESALASAIEVAQRIAPRSPNLTRLETRGRASGGRRS